MKATHCFIRIHVEADDKFHADDAMGDLRYSQTDLIEHQLGIWSLEIPFSYGGQENVAAGDLEDDISPHFPELMRAKSIFRARIEFHIVVGGAHPNPFPLKAYTVAMIAALGAELFIYRSEEDAEQSGGGNSSALRASP